MTLIKSISGIRGTIGGASGDTLNPLDIVKFTSAYATFIARNAKADRRPLVVVGRDARISGEMVRSIVCGTLLGMGFDVVDLGLATTPTTELAVRHHNADGGIIITASHNPTQWNALKLLNSEGEFLTAADGAEVLDIAAREDFVYADVDNLGSYTTDNDFDSCHIKGVLDLELVDVEAVKERKFRVCIDAINSVGGVILPRLLDALGVEYTILNGEPTGRFAHNPEPLEKNLQGIMSEVKKGGYDMGIVVDPDVDRLAFISEDGTMFGEEYTLVSVADYVLGHTHGNTVSNLSSTRALRDVTLRHGGQYFASAVGEVNNEDEDSECRYRRRGQWRCDISSEPLWSRRTCRYSPVPFSPCRAQADSDRTSCHASRVFHSQKPHRPHSRYRHRRHTLACEGDVRQRASDRYRRCEDRLCRQVGSSS